MKKILLLLYIFSASCISYAADTGIPVHDYELNEKLSNVEKSTNTSASLNGLQLTSLIEMTVKQQEQISQLQELISKVTGSSGYGDLANDAEAKNTRHYEAYTWQNALKILRSGNTIGHYTSYQTNDNYSQTYTAALGEDAYAASDRNILFHNATVDTAAAAYDISEWAYDQTESRLTAIESMMSEIENAPDIKAAIDLNNRLSAENALALAEVIRMQSVLLKVQTNSLQKQNNIVTNEADLIRYER